MPEPLATAIRYKQYAAEVLMELGFDWTEKLDEQAMRQVTRTCDKHLSEAVIRIERHLEFALDSELRKQEEQDICDQLDEIRAEE